MDDNKTYDEIVAGLDDLEENLVELLKTKNNNY